MLFKKYTLVLLGTLLAAACLTVSCSSPRREIKNLRVAVKNLMRDVDDLTAEQLESAVSSDIKFDKVLLKYTAGQHSSVTIGPDGKLYACAIDGRIKRFTIKADGTLTKPEVLYSLQDISGKRIPRITIGFTFDPTATAENLVAWVTHSSFAFTDGPDWDGKLTRLSGTNLEMAQDVLVQLPRSAKDHLTNSIAFGPDGALYFCQGSNTAMGSPDSTWANREEHLLTAAVLRLDLTKLKVTELPLNVKTAAGGHYNPYNAYAPLTIYATGIRNAYDLLWHSNGELYVPANGSGAGGNTPASVAGTRRPDGSLYAGPQVPAVNEVPEEQKDYLFRVEKGGYYGHPNPSRGEYVMNGGNPSAGQDPAEFRRYPVGVLPDVNWRGYAFEFPVHNSPNGIIEYQSNAFGGQLKGKLLVARLMNRDLMVLEPGGDQENIVRKSVGSAVPGFSDFLLPIDLTEDRSTGNIYVAEYGGEGCITLLRPQEKPEAPVLSFSKLLSLIF